MTTWGCAGYCGFCYKITIFAYLYCACRSEGTFKFSCWKSLFLFIFFLHHISTQSICPKVCTFSKNSRAVLSYSSSIQQWQKLIANAPTSINIFRHQIQVILWESRWQVNFCSPCILLPLYYEYQITMKTVIKVTFTGITVHKGCSVLAMWRGRATEIRGTLSA